jgi:UDP-N-acetylmuramate dehydrogenase
VGGALYGNAGCYGEDIGSYTIECTHATLDGATVETRPAAWYEFTYRDSRLKREPRVLLSCLLQLRRGEHAAIQKVIDEKLEVRRVKHPQWRIEPTAGSYFKNLPPDWQMPGARLSPGTRRVAAGQLLDECDCRGLRVGDAMVFAKHANIIVNAGHATAREVLELAAIMKERVRVKFGVTLEEEVMFLGEKPALRAHPR